MSDKQIITISPTALNSLQSCLYQYHLGHLEGWRPTGEKDKKLEKGSFIHYLLEIYYKGIRADITINRQQLSEVVIEIGRAKSLEYSLEATEIETLIDVFRLYVVTYKGESFTPLAIEEPFSVELYDDEKVKILFEGKLDLIIEDSGIRMLTDHKTEASHKQFVNQLDNQFIGYCYATGINTMVVNQITLTKTPQFHRQPLSYSKKFLEEWKNTTIEWILTGLHYIENKNFPQNFRSCYFCYFKEVCKQDFENHQGVLEQLYVKKAPYDIFGGK